MSGGEHAKRAKARQGKILKKVSMQLVLKKFIKYRNLKIGKELGLKFLNLEKGDGKV